MGEFSDAAMASFPRIWLAIYRSLPVYFAGAMNTKAIIGAIVLGSLAACGGGSIGGSTTFTTSVPGSTPLNQVSGTQLTTLCNDVDKYVTAFGENVLAKQTTTLKQGKCTALGYEAAATANANANAIAANSTTDAELQSACSMEYNQCLQLTVSPTSRTCFQTPPGSCTASVSQYAACLNDVVVAAEATLGSLPSCSSLTVGTFSADLSKAGIGVASWAATSGPASCATFSAACSYTGEDLLDPSSIAPYSL